MRMATTPRRSGPHLVRNSLSPMEAGSADGHAVVIIETVQSGSVRLSLSARQHHLCL